jgi:hypothetical protein
MGFILAFLLKVALWELANVVSARGGALVIE